MHSKDQQQTPTAPMPFFQRTVSRLRQSLRFKRRRSWQRSSSGGPVGGDKPPQWQVDDGSVRAGTCCFPVKYLGHTEVYESRGIAICEQAFKALKHQRRKKIKSGLHISGDGLRVVDSRNKALIVDQTVEKVSFCAPDRNYPHGFSYICRDGTTRRWICHCFMAIGYSGEQLSHAVGCAFTVCYEKKQALEKEAVRVQFSKDQTSFTRLGSFRQVSITERMLDPQEVKPAEPVPSREVDNPFAVARPRATAEMLERQGSARFGHINDTAPFKRNLSLRLNELPSTVARRENTFNASANTVSPIMEEAAMSEDAIAQLCQQITQDIDTMNTDGTRMGFTNNVVSQFDPLVAGGDTTVRSPPWQVNYPANPNPSDPFNSKWAASSVQPASSTNPFVTSHQPSNIKAFTVQM
ncbi:PREDICTED: protein numb-like isoform X2 [Priapulus caudatus]|uniref:Protein numb-like isoform X2 n=1 Tax=Priapulus caudatus TaxID=37621 RepID=A0ABM1EJJ9_PRICU|nr:PREDICTED: protein numb-like isoform X2 [Priapulus caudatus]